MQKINKSPISIIKSFIFCSSFITINVFADGLSIDKVYHPYVQPLERELEFRWINYDTNKSTHNQIYRLGYGQTLASGWFLEAYLIGGRKTNEFQADAYELEAKYQLTEQGEYDADWGILFELEKETDQDILELVTTLLVESEWGRTVATANLALALEAGSDIKSEVETSAAGQIRYRYSQLLEPALEFYMAQETSALGPVLMGEKRFGLGKKLHWEFGVIAGISSKTPDATLRTLVEFEF